MSNTELRTFRDLARRWRTPQRVVLLLLVVFLWLLQIPIQNLGTWLSQDPAPADTLPMPALSFGTIPTDEWDIVAGKIVRLTPEYAAERRAATAQVKWLSAIGAVVALVLTFCFLLMAYRVIRSRRWRRSGLCAACGYDLHGIAELDPCPECGCSRTAAIT